MTKSIQLELGQKFNRLTVIKLDHIQEYISPNYIISNKEFYLCKCDCGNECIVLKQYLKSKHTKSCGCFHKETAKNNGLNNKTHGLINTKLYSIWLGMKTRCYNKKFKYFNYYGGRGITMCDVWLDNPKSFYDWAIANGYQDNLTIDRIDVNGNYEPNNCRWTTGKEQCRNRRNNRLITYKGSTHCIAEWSEILGINKYILYNRMVRYNWSIEKSFTTPVKKYKLKNN